MQVSGELAMALVKTVNAEHRSQLDRSHHNQTLGTENQTSLPALYTALILMGAM